MANNKIYIKRTAVTGNKPTTSQIANGELAVNMTDGILYSTNGSVVFEIGANNTNTQVTGNLTVKGIIANGSLGSAGQTLTSNGTATYWATGAGSGTVTSVGSGDGLTGGPITSTGTLSVVANDGIIANATGVYVKQGTGTVVNATGVHVNSTYIGTLTANNTSFVGTVSAANVVSNAQLSGNLANYQTTAGLSANVATLTANNTSFVGTVSAANVVSNAQLSGNLANYQTTAGLSANVATLTANNSSFLGGVAAASYVQNTDSRTLSGNLVFSGSNTTINAVFRVVNSTANVFFVGSDGNVGIGETNPLRKLTVRADSVGSITAAGFYNADTTANNGSVFSFRSDTTGTGATTFQEFAAIAGRYEDHNHATRSGSLDFFTIENGIGANRMRVAANGNVGINNATPDATLAITGTANVSGNARFGSVLTVAANVILGTTTITANGGVGSAGQVLTSGGAGNVYWTTPQVGDITSVTAGNGLTGGGTSGDVTLDVGAANGITVAADTVGVLVGPTQTLNSTGVHVNNTLSITTLTTSGNITLGTAFSANGTFGSAGQVLKSAGSGANAYWAADTDTNTTYDLLAIANTEANAGRIRLKDVNNSNDDVIVTGANGVVVSSNATHVIITGQTGDITSVTAGNGLTGGGTSGDVTLDVGAANGITVAADSIAVTEGAGLTVNTTGVHVKANTGIVANSTGTFVNATYIGTLTANNSTYFGGYTWAAPAILGSTTANGASLTYANVSGQVNTATLYASTSANIASVVQANSLGVHVGTNVVANTTTLRVGNTTLTTTNAVFGGTIAANGGIGSAGQVLTSGAAGNVYWTTPTTGTVTSVASGNGIIGGTITSTGTLYVDGANGISVDASGINVLAGNNQLVSNATGLWVDQTKIDHDLLSNFVADEHVAHSTVSISAGSGLTGGGTIAASRTLAVSPGNTQLVANATGLWLDQTKVDHDLLANFVSNEHIDHSTVSVTAGNGLTGGGTIAASRTLSVVAGNNQLVSNATGVWIDQTKIDHDLLSNFVADEHVAHSGVTLTAGNGLTGGGTIAASRTFDVGAGNGISVAADAVYVNGGSTLTVNTLGAHVNSTLALTTLSTTGNVTIGGNLTINGNVTVIGANNVSIVDNFLYLNSNNTTQNIDLGFAGNYNDGTYKHAGFFRDATDGFWKPFDGYTPEPDAAVNIDTSNNTFNIAGMWIGNTRIGNTTVYATINSTAYSGSANNSTYLAGYTWGSPAVIGGTAANGASFTYANVSGQVNTATLYATTSANIASAVQANSTGIWTTGTVNGAVHSIGSTFIANTLGVYHTGTMNAASHTVGSSFIANTTGAYHTGTVNAAVVSSTNATFTRVTDIYQGVGDIRNNLGNPSVEEKALFHGQMNNKFRFVAPTSQEESTDNVTWTSSTRATAAQLGDLMIGEGQGTSFIAIPSGTVGTAGYYRLTWDVYGTVGYIYLNHLYIYSETQALNTTVTIEAFNNATSVWNTIASGSVSNWPGHSSIKHNTIPYNPSTSAGFYGKVRVTFAVPSRNNTNAVYLGGIEWFGGYPAAKRNVESYDRFKNVTFPANVAAGTFAGNISGSYANISGQVNTATLYATTSANIASIVQANSLGVHVGANVVANTTALRVGNTTITTTNAVFGGTIAANGGIGTSGQVLTSGAAGNVYWTTPTTGTVTSVATGNGIIGGTITSTGTLYVTGGSTLTINTVGVHVNSTLALTTLSTTGNVTLGAALRANGSTGTAGFVLKSGGTANAYWAADTDTNTTYDLLAVANTEANAGRIRLKDVNNSNDDVIVTGANGVVVSSNATHIIVTGQTGDITSVTAGNGLTGGGTSGDVTLTVGAANGITVSATTVGVTEGVGLAVNTTGVHVKANTGIVANSTGTFVNAAYIATIASNSATYSNGSITNTFTVGTASYFVSNGNLGVGTSTPSTKLYVNGTTYLAGVTTFLTGAWHVSSDSKNRFYYGPNGRTYFGSGDGSYEFRNASDTGSVFIDNSANTGIGNSSPSHKLSVNGDGYFTGDLTVAGGQIYTSQESTRSKLSLYGTDGTYAIGMQQSVTYGGLNDWAMTFQFNNSVSRGFWWGHNGHSVAQGAMALTNDGKLTVAKSMRLGFGESDATDPGTTYTLEVNGSFAATTKSFVIDHPTKEGMKLRYGSLEGPENGVYVRGRTNTNIIELPDYWTGLVDKDSITVNLTAIGKKQDLYVKEIKNNRVIIGGSRNIDCYYTVFGERKDVVKFEVEY